MSYISEIARLKARYAEAYGRKDYLNALLIVEEIFRTHEQNGADDTYEYARDCFVLAELYFDMKNHEKCIELYKRAMRIANGVSRKTPFLHEILTNLSVSYSHIGEYDVSLKIMLQVLRIIKFIDGAKGKEYINCLYNVGVCYYDISEFDNALHYHMLSLKARKDKNLDYADNLNFIGYDFEGKGDMKNAIIYFEKAISLIKKLYGNSSSEYFTNIYYLAAVYESDGNFELAGHYLEETVGLFKTVLTEEHPYYAEALNKLASVYTRLNRSKEALKLRLNALSILEHAVGSDNLYYANCLKYIGDIYLSALNYTLACEFYEKSVEIKKRLLGCDSDDYIKDSLKLAEIYNKAFEMPDINSDEGNRKKSDYGF